MSDKTGVDKLLRERGRATVLIELLQHAWASKARNVEVTVHPVPTDSSAVYIKVAVDDPCCFSELAAAFAAFTAAEKSGKIVRRGTTNLGEKLILNLCTRAQIGSATGTCTYSNNTVTYSESVPKTGSYFEGFLTAPQCETTETVRKLKELLIPHNVRVVINKGVLAERMPCFVFEDSLPTEFADTAGYLKNGVRKTMVRVFDVRPGETAHIYELGVPIAPIEGAFHIDVGQKLQMNFTRDEVTEWYLKNIQAMVKKYAKKKLARRAQ